MNRLISSDVYDDFFEYHGNTAIEHARICAGETVWRDWIIFDTVEEAADYFNAACAD